MHIAHHMRCPLVAGLAINRASGMLLGYYVHDDACFIVTSAAGIRCRHHLSQ
jgi:hypothetical protein